MKRCLFLVLLLSSAFLGHAKHGKDANPTAEDYLQHLAEAVSSLNFQMTFVTMQSDSELRSYLWRKSNVDNQSISHLSVQNGPYWEALKIQNTVYQIGEQGLISVSQGQLQYPLPMTLLTQPTQLQDAYNFVLLGKSRISGRAATKIRIVSNDNSRFTYTLWLDNETGLLLQLLTHDQTGKLREQLQTTSLDIVKDVIPFFKQLDFSRYPALEETPALPIQPSLVSFNWLPVGMNILQLEKKQMGADIGSVLHAVLSDGLSSVSVYIKPIARELPKEGGIDVGADNLFTVQKNQHEITVIGKLPQKSAERLIDGIVFGVNSQ